MDQYAHTTKKAVITIQIVDEDFTAAIIQEKIKYKVTYLIRCRLKCFISKGVCDYCFKAEDQSSCCDKSCPVLAGHCSSDDQCDGGMQDR